MVFNNSNFSLQIKLQIFYSTYGVINSGIFARNTKTKLLCSIRRYATGSGLTNEFKFLILAWYLLGLIFVFYMDLLPDM